VRIFNNQKKRFPDMEGLAAIWSDVDRLLNKPTLRKPINTHLCINCNGVKVFTKEGMPVCSQCGYVQEHYVDDSPEWTSGISEDGRVSDPSRCGNPNPNPELFSDAWGKGTVISTKNTSNYENKRMAKINFHQSMNHVDRSLFHAYRDIDEACHTLPDSVLKDAKMMYRKFNIEKLTRGAVRSGIKANCVLYACRLSNIPRTTKEIADMFGIQSKDISRTTQMFKDTLLGKTEKNYVTKPFNVMQRLLNSFEVTRNERLECNKMCTKLENCTELMSKTPNSVASVVIYMVMDGKMSKNKISDQCSVSIPTINKIENIIKQYLEE
jgi:transcription initiation factor TFIIIB Brf1 subunit/transcription initiation factor TFIIB